MMFGAFAGWRFRPPVAENGALVRFSFPLPPLAALVLNATDITKVAMTPDGKSYAYSSQQYLNTLYLVENLESWRRPTIWSRLSGRNP